jgi:predicted acylesterase/phospholipase RssA
MAPGKYFKEWLGEQLAASPLARELGKKELTFADVRRRDLPPRSEVPEVTDAEYERATYRLHVIASEITSGRMLVLPDDLPDYEDEHGKPLVKDEFPVVDAVRMSMSYPFLFNPVTLHKNGRPHYVVDGGLLSNFPVWLFDSPHPKRPTWGFRLHPGTATDESLPYRKVPRPLWAVPLLKAMFSAATEAWDRQHLKQAISARTVSIPTHAISTTDFGLGDDDAADLYKWGEAAATAFFNDPEQQTYLNLFGKTVGGPEVFGAPEPGSARQQPSPARS